MNNRAFTNDSLRMMYEGVRGALASDYALIGLGEESKFRVRETPEWKEHAADLEMEMLRRGMIVDVIDCRRIRERCPGGRRDAGKRQTPGHRRSGLGARCDSSS